MVYEAINILVQKFEAFINIFQTNIFWEINLVKTLHVMEWVSIFDACMLKWNLAQIKS